MKIVEYCAQLFRYGVPLILFSILFSLIYCPLGEAAIDNTIIITADELIQLDEETNRAEAVGNVTLEYGNIKLLADRAQADLQTQEISAYGNVKIIQKGKELFGQELHYNWAKDTGIVIDAMTTAVIITSNVAASSMEERTFGSSKKAEKNKIILKGRRIEIMPDKWILESGFFTTCDLPHPHYNFTAEKILYYPQNKIVAKKISFFLGKHRIITIPFYKVSVKRETERRSSPIPKIGYSKTYGLYLQSNYPLLSMGSNTPGNINLIYSFRQGPAGGIRIEKNSSHQYWSLAASRKEEVVDKLVSDLTLSRLPELNYQINSIRLGKSPLTLNSQISLGKFTEYPYRFSDFRIFAQIALSLPIVKTKDTYLYGELLARKSWYNKGGPYQVIDPSLQLDSQLTKKIALNISYNSQHFKGKTPFQFDNVDLKREIRPELTFISSPKWQYTIFARYDLDAKRLPDWGCKVNRTMHCLKYTLGWGQRKKQVEIGVDLAGF